MNTANVCQLEIAGALVRPRILAMKLGAAFLLGLPFLVVAMPMRVRVVGLLMLTLFTCFFGAAVATVRSRSEGRMTRLWLLPIPRWQIIGDQVLAGGFVDALQLGPLFALFVVLYGQRVNVAAWVQVGVLLCASLLALNLLGLALGRILRSNPEVHLFGALGVGVLAFFSGLIPVPPFLRGAPGILSAANPLSRLAESMERMADGGLAGSSPMGGGAFLLALLLVFLWRALDWRGPGLTEGSR